MVWYNSVFKYDGLERTFLVTKDYKVWVLNCFVFLNMRLGCRSLIKRIMVIAYNIVVIPVVKNTGASVEAN